MKPLTLVIERPAKPKARPRVTNRGTYMPPAYRNWKTAVAEELALRAGRSTFGDQPVSIELGFGSDMFIVRITATDATRPKGIRGDIDNLAGGCLDAIQESGIINNDRNVHALAAVMDPS